MRQQKKTTYEEDFYDLLEKEYDRCPRHDIKLILGDFNPKNWARRRIKPTIDMFNLHKESNDNGIRLINAASVVMIIGGTSFRHEKLRKFTWRSPDGNTSQTGHVLVNAQHRIA
jgi:hypothetical protein